MTDTGAEKRFERLLTSFLTDDSSASGAACPDPGVRAAYYEAKLTESESHSFEEHLSWCAICQAEIAALVTTEMEAEPSPAIAEPKKPEAPTVAEAPPKKGERWREVFDIPRKSEAERQSEVVVASAEPMSEPPVLPFRSGGRPATRWRWVVPAAIAATAVLAISVTLQFGPTLADLSQRGSESPTAPPAPGKSNADLLTAERAEAPPMPTAAPPVPPAPRAANQASPFGLEASRDTKGARASSAAPSAPIPQAPSVRSPAAEAQRPADEAATRFQKLADLGTAAVGGALAKDVGSVLVVARTNVDVAWRLNGGLISRSDDGGKTWRPQISLVASTLVSGSAPSAETCWIAGKNGTVLRTTDGEHWERLALPTKDDIVQITAWNAQSATFRTGKGERYSTNDGGQTWNKV